MMWGKVSIEYHYEVTIWVIISVFDISCLFHISLIFTRKIYEVEFLAEADIVFFTYVIEDVDRFFTVIYLCYGSESLLHDDKLLTTYSDEDIHARSVRLSSRVPVFFDIGVVLLDIEFFVEKIESVIDKIVERIEEDDRTENIRVEGLHLKEEDIPIYSHKPGYDTYDIEYIDFPRAFYDIEIFIIEVLDTFLCGHKRE